MYGPDGACLWNHQIATDMGPAADAKLTVTPGGDVVVAGSYHVATGVRGFVARLTGGPAGGAQLWSKFIDSTDGAVPGWFGVRGVAVSNNNKVYVYGQFLGNLNVGGTDHYTGGDTDIVLAAYDAQGNFESGKVFGDASNQEATGIAVDSTGRVLITGYLSGTANFGGNDLSSTGPNDRDVFLAAFSDQNFPLFSKRWGDESLQEGTSVAVDAQDDILLTGVDTGSVNFGGEDIANAGSGTSFVVKLSPAEKFIWSKGFGGSGIVEIREVALDTMSNAVVAGHLQGTVDFGAGQLASGGNGVTDLVVAKLGR